MSRNSPAMWVNNHSRSGKGIRANGRGVGQSKMVAAGSVVSRSVALWHWRKKVDPRLRRHLYALKNVVLHEIGDQSPATGNYGEFQIIVGTYTPTLVSRPPILKT